VVDPEVDGLLWSTGDASAEFACMSDQAARDPDRPGACRTQRGLRYAMDHPEAHQVALGYRTRLQCDADMAR
jgi:hypothetical protein